MVPCLMQLPPPAQTQTFSRAILVCQGFLLHTGFLHDSQSLGGGQEALSEFPGDDFRAPAAPLRGGGRLDTLHRSSVIKLRFLCLHISL